MTIRITGDGPQITATGSGSTVLVEISTGQHDPGSFSGVHNDLTGRSTTGAHVGTAVSIDPTGFNGNLDGTITNAQLLAAAVDDLTTGGGGGVTGDSELVATSTTLTGPPHTIAVAAAGSIDITVTLPDATAGDKGLVWYIRNLNSDSVVYVANLAEGDETITESKGLLVAGIETDTPGTYTWMKVGFVSETAAAGGGAALSDATPQALGVAAAGTGTAAARDDHVHAMPTAADVGADADGAAQAVADSLGTAATKDAGSAGGVAELDVTGKVPSAQLPSYVDDVVEVANFAALPGTGETGKIYVTVDTNVTYRWSGSAYVEISASLALGETSSTAYRGDRGKTAYDHSQVVSGNPHGTTAADVGAAASSHNHAASEVTSGTLDIARIPTGTTSTTVPLGNDSRFSDARTPNVAGSNDDFMQRKSGAWTYRTVAQVKTDLSVPAAPFVLETPVGQYVGPSAPNTAISNQTDLHLNAGGRGAACLIYLAAGTYDRIGVWLQSAGAAIIRIGLYAAGSGGLPAARVLDAGTIDVSGSTGLREITISQTVTAGWYWASVSADSYTSTFSLYGLNSSLAPFIAGGVHYTTVPLRQKPGVASTGFGTSGIPDPFPTVSWSPDGAPKVILRRSA